MEAVYIGLIECSLQVEQKINSKHGVTLLEVREAVQWPSRPLRVTRLDGETDPRGPRLALRGITAAGRVLNIVLYPVDEKDGTWRLGTAVPMV